MKNPIEKFIIDVLTFVGSITIGAMICIILKYFLFE